jgi:hypothetical protein
MSEEEEKKLTRLEKRLVVNVDFDDQALNSLGFGTNIYLYVGVPRMGEILQRGVGKYPQGICLGNSNDHGAYPR